jgi:predicted unusual protein kinase regulating ubiquinone biosynthesis (AarF/ABC1/UbiB family)
VKTILTPEKSKKTLDQEIERVLNDMEQYPVGSNEYRQAADNLKVLCEARGVKSPRTLSTDTIVSAAVNILGILLVLNYEQLHVITSKALGFSTFKGGRG